MNLRPFAILMLAASPALAVPQDARGFYNEGVGKLGKGELRDAEMSLRKAAGAEIESVQPLALYNLGHVRFRQGEETMKGEGNRQQLLDSSAAATAVAEEAIRNSTRAPYPQVCSTRLWQSPYTLRADPAHAARVWLPRSCARATACRFAVRELCPARCDPRPSRRRRSHCRRAHWR